MKQLRATVSGQVQMVGFRFFVEREAQRLGLSGWVRNGDDGRTVEVTAEGDETSLRALEAALRQGPPFSRVAAVDAAWSDETEGLSGFEARL